MSRDPYRRQRRTSEQSSDRSLASFHHALHPSNATPPEPPYVFSAMPPPPPPPQHPSGAGGQFMIPRVRGPGNPERNSYSRQGHYEERPAPPAPQQQHRRERRGPSRDEIDPYTTRRQIMEQLH